MKSSSLPSSLLLILLILLVAGCGGGGGGGASKELTGITIAPVNPSIAQGTTLQFSATGHYSDGSSADLTAAVTWSSSAPGVASIGTGSGTVGKVSALVAGTSSIRASSGTLSASSTLTVTTADLVGIAITPLAPSVALGLTQQFGATGTFSDNSTQDVTDLVTWSSSAPGVAGISNATGSQGLASTLSAGSTTIGATRGSLSSSTVLTVLPATLISLSVTPANPSLAVGASQQFTATGTYSDASTRDLTGSVTWSSSNTAAATISNSAGSNGQLLAVSAGTSSIGASIAISQPVPGTISGATTLTVTGIGATLANVVPITVNGSLCSSGSYPNKPCVSVTICTPGTSTCQTVSDILLDTGSYGLRIFKSALTVSLPQVSVSAGSLAECVQFADGSSDWGPVQQADLVLGGEPAVSVPIHVLDASFGTRPRACTSAETSPAAAGFNGILGVGLFAEDCGSTCVGSRVGLYYACSGTSCSGTTVPLTSQVANPVALLPLDNNGVLLQLPAVGSSGAPSVSGNLILGIGTRTNNTTAGVTRYPADQSGNFSTTFNGTVLSSSFIDSGSNGLFFPDSALPVDSSGSWYVPSQAVSLSATNTGAGGSPSGVVSFSVGNALTLTNTSNNVFNNLGGVTSGTFDWGLPFFLGRSVFVGLEGTSSPLGSGPFWAY